jgi:zinc transport system substrate-binding protein
VRLRIIFILIGAVVVGTVTAAFAAGGDATRAGRNGVVAAFYPLAYAVEQVGGPGLNVTNLTPAGAEPHDIELRPADVVKVKDAGLVLLMGHGFQPQLERVARTSPARTLSLLDTPGLGRIGNDPHVWLDPLRYALVVRAVGKALHAEPAAARLVARLRALDREYRAGLAHCARRDIVTSHAAFGYLAERYGLRQIAVEGLNPEAEPAPGDLARVVARVRASGATTVFTETLVSPRVARTVSRETGTRTAVLDPLEGLTSRAAAAGADYFTVMRANLAALRQGLGCSS